MKHPDRLLTPPEAAEMLGFRKPDGTPSVNALDQQRRHGNVPFVRLPGSRLIRYRLSTLLQLIEDNERRIQA